jgi:hypothetical protein
MPKLVHKTPQFASLEAAAAGLGIEIELLRFIKAKGCTAFKAGGRVNGDEVRQWMAENEPELQKSAGSLSLKERKMLEEIRKIVEDVRRLQIANDAKDKVLIPAEQVIQFWIEAQNQRGKILAAKLENEYPQLVAGLDVPSARVYGKRLLDDIDKAEVQMLAALKVKFIKGK